MKKLLSLIAVVFLFGCASRLTSIPAQITYETAAHKDLTSLPPPEKKLYMTVYSYPDWTGQYKSDDFTNSTAINQGNISLLIEAVEDSHWVIATEREGLNNLLTERKIIRSVLAELAEREARNKDRNKDSEEKEMASLPPLKVSSIILEGGVIAYETNVATGGVVARYFGIGSSVEYRYHQVTVSLRAVSVDTGLILEIVSVTKLIYSLKTDSNVFRYVLPKRLLEFETGVARNEPIQMCVREAIEKAVLNLLIEGILDGHWHLKNPEDIKSPVIQRYLEEKLGGSKQVIFDRKGNVTKIEEE